MAFMNMKHVQPVFLCGGSGSRLWPLSRSEYPKQFLRLDGNDSLFQQSLKRLNGGNAKDIVVLPPFIVTGEEHRFLALDQLREVAMEPGATLLEPVGRNTAPALTLAALAALESGGDPILIVTPTDQLVTDKTIFTAASQMAIREAASGAIVTLGIAPDRAATGYGYIEAANNATPPDLNSVSLSVSPARLVTGFFEKPNAQTASRFLEDGSFFWNAGIFVLKASVWMRAIGRFRPDIAEATLASWEVRTSEQSFIRPGKSEFSAVPAESIDYAVMERCPGSEFQVKMVTLESGWSDLGGWDAVWQILAKDAAGNAHVGDVLTADSRNNLVHANSRLVSLVGVEDLVVVETADAVLVTERNRSHEVKVIVGQLEKTGREEHLIHRKVHRPWGWYNNIDEGDCFKVKRIQVNPKASLSLQKHVHRAEHWVVVKGMAEVRCGDKTIILKKNESTYIPQGEVHRLSNPYLIPLEIIEVQSGSYLGEDDITRLQDQYGR